MKIYFARHGESQANLLHEISNRGLRHGLTPQGRQQAAALAERLRSLSITQIYSSPVLRAIETSVIVADRLGLEYEVVEALREYDCGVLEGRSDEAAWQMWQELFDDWTIHRRWERRLEGGESFHDIQARFVPFVDGLVGRYGSGEANLLCVSHGGVYRLMLPQVLKGFDPDRLPERWIGYTGCYVAELTPVGLEYIEAVSGQEIYRQR